MAYGFYVKQNNGLVVDDTTAGSQLIAIEQVAMGASAVFSYTNYNGFTIFVTRESTSIPVLNHHNYTITYPSGVPTLTVSPPANYGSATRFTVFVR